VRRAEPGGRRDYNRAISQLLAFWLYDDLSHDRKSKTLVWYFIRQSEGPLLYQLCPGSERVAQDRDILRCHKKGREAPLAAGAFHVDSFSGCGFITNGPLPEYPRYIFSAHQSRSADLFKTLLAAALEGCPRNERGTPRDLPTPLSKSRGPPARRDSTRFQCLSTGPFALLRKSYRVMDQGRVSSASSSPDHLLHHGRRNFPVMMRSHHGAVLQLDYLTILFLIRPIPTLFNQAASVRRYHKIRGEK
jgi:hypothetical protein